VKFSIYQESRKGARPDNQDRIGYFYSSDALLMVVADGMGVHLHGEVAAQIAVQFLAETFQREAQPRVADPFMLLENGFANAHKAILDYATAGMLAETPRTTCVACVVQDSIAYWAHVGDSRLYHLRDARIHVQTRDHSRVQMLVDRGYLSEDAVATHPDRNKIFNCLGGINPPQVELSRKTVLQPGDTLMLCSDGLWGPLSGDSICAALEDRDLMHAIPALLDAAEMCAGRECDNLSVVAMIWADSYTGGAGQVSTQLPQFTGFTARMDKFGKAAAGHGDLTEEQIEQAVAEIRSAIEKYSGK
jgi:PPM family protein phosphatase